MVEGSLWVYGQTDLTDYYADRLTLRQVWNRLVVLPRTAPSWALIESETEKAEQDSLANRLLEQRERARRMREEQSV